MIKFTNLKTKLAGFFLGLLMIMAFGQTGFGQLIDEGFESGEPAGWTNNSSYYNTGSAHTGTYKAGMNSTGDWIQTTQVTNPGTLSLWVRTSSDPDNWVLDIQTSPDGSTWTNIPFTITEDGAGGDVSDTYAQFSKDINLEGNYYIRFYLTSRSTGSCYLDDVLLTEYTPASSPDPITAFTATTSSETQIDLAWTQNAATDAVMVIYDEDGTFTDPVDGTSYAVANTDLGGTVIYNESGTSFSHTGLTANTHYYYKAWSVDASNNYSTAVTGDATTDADVTAPTFVGGTPKSANISTTSFDVVVQLDEPGTAYYILLPDGAPEPNVAAVKTGAVINVTTANTDFSSTLSGGLTASTAYDIYFVAEDDEATPNVQATVTKLDVTTAATLSSDAEILTFALAEQTAAATIGTNTVDIEVAEGTDVTALTPTITVSAGAQVSPTSGTVKDFTNPVTYTVTAEDGTTTKDWTVTVTVEATPPVFVTGYPKSANITTTSCDVVVQLNEIGTVYYLKLADGAATPSVSDVKTNGTAISIPAANTSYSATISGLTTATAYDIYFVAEDAYSNTQASVTLLEVTTETGTPTITDLFFSEYIEASVGNNKALEIYNGTGNDINLSNYVIRVNYNGNPWNEVFELPAISLASGDVYVIAHAEADATILAVADTAVVSPYSGGTSYIANFNGDDARALCKVSGTDTTIIDVIGNYTEDPGDGWDVAGVTNATKDHTLLRKTSTTSGNTNWTASAGTSTEDSEWEVKDDQTYSFLGYFGASSANDILSFILPTQTEEATINTTDHTVAITVGFGTDVTALKPTIEISAGATITDTTVAHDFTNPVVYTVTAENGDTQAWTATVTVAPVSSEAEIKSFVLAEQTGDAVINSATGTIAIEVAIGTDITSLKPTIEISYGATITDTTVAHDFTNPVVYTVTAEDGTTTKDWTVTVTVQEASVVSIYDIQYTTDASGISPYNGELVTTSGIVTGIASGKGFFIQDSASAWNGVYVYSYDFVDTVAVGDSITITAEVKEFTGTEGVYINGTTELQYVDNIVIDSSNVDLPEPIVITATDLTEAMEGVFIKLEGYTCINVDFDTHHNSLYVKEGVADTLMVHNLMYRDINPVLNNEYTITGIGHYDWNNFKVEPRDSNDFVVTTVVNNPPTIDNVVLSPATPIAGTDVTVVADYNDDVEVIEKHFYYGFDIDSVNKELTLEAVGFSGNTFRAVIPAQDAGVTVYFKIEATDVEFTTTKNSSYNVVTGIDDVNMNNISIYPNPVNDVLHLDNLNNIQNIAISNIIGQKVKTIANINSKKLQINTSDLERGVYIISITDNNGNVRSSKLLKK